MSGPVDISGPHIVDQVGKYREQKLARLRADDITNSKDIKYFAGIKAETNLIREINVIQTALGVKLRELIVFLESQK